MLDYHPQISIEEGLAGFYEWYTHTAHRQRLIVFARLILVAAILAAGLLPLAASRSTVSAQSSPDPRFGAVEAFRDPDSARDLNLGWERILFYWSELQPTGPDDWNIFHVEDGWISTAAAQGRQVIGLLENTPRWATDGPNQIGVPRGLYLPIDDPNNLWAHSCARS